ncbi:predicted protein [Uncinocarpus reesii 1704]|uniref:Uncharacterized protein n=1 Tax=Uncinocarpus reesii (strain UAMH 1704) TaxID=336963 RepID=C4JQ71_UNCRE|nr:uncharacterized protein UREG_03304 [Uncinocarpus reesii 1704]EEP78458.1 predicted protein [Uncinocarpus reesii 1704]
MAKEHRRSENMVERYGSETLELRLREEDLKLQKNTSPLFYSPGLGVRRLELFTWEVVSTARRFDMTGSNGSTMNLA